MRMWRQIVGDSCAGQETVPPEELKHEFQCRVRGIGHIVSMLFPWDAPINLTRIWCAVARWVTVLRGVVVHACGTGACSSFGSR
jgi:hypothetical protein